MQTYHAATLLKQSLNDYLQMLHEHFCHKIFINAQFGMHVYLQLLCSPFAREAWVGWRQMPSQMSIPLPGKKAPDSSLNLGSASVLVRCFAIMNLALLISFCAAQRAAA